LIELGIILIGTGLIIIIGARVMIRSTKKTAGKSIYYNDVDDIETQQKQASKTEKELTDMVKRSMRILYVVGMTCMGLGMLLIMFSGNM